MHGLCDFKTSELLFELQQEALQPEYLTFGERLNSKF